MPPPRPPDNMFTPERHLPTIPGQRGHSPQRHNAAGTAAPTTTDTGNTQSHSPQRANPTQTAYVRSRKRAQTQGQRSGTRTLVRPPKDPDARLVPNGTPMKSASHLSPSQMLGCPPATSHRSPLPLVSIQDHPTSTDPSVPRQPRAPG